MIAYGLDKKEYQLGISKVMIFAWTVMRRCSRLSDVSERRVWGGMGCLFVDDFLIQIRERKKAGTFRSSPPLSSRRLFSMQASTELSRLVSGFGDGVVNFD
jgi:hypothetical protein